MPIYEFYCPDNNKIYQFLAKSRAQAERVPPCPDNPAFRMEKIISGFNIGGGTRKSEPKDGVQSAEGDLAPEAAGMEGGAPPIDDNRMEAALSQLEGEMGGMDENDPRAMARMMRKMSEMTGERLDEQMEEVVRKLEEGTDPDKLEEQLGDAFPDEEGSPGGGGRSYGAPSRDPMLYDY
jgi:hypothetical protein